MRQQTWGSLLSITDTSDPRSVTGAYGEVRPSGWRHLGTDSSVRELLGDEHSAGAYEGDFTRQNVIAPVDCVVSEVRDTEWAYGLHVILSTGVWEILVAHGDRAGLMRAAGERLRQGDWVMVADNSGPSTAPHLHTGVRRIGEGWIDPWRFMEGREPMDIVDADSADVIAAWRQRYDDLDKVHLQDVHLGAEATRLCNHLANLIGHDLLDEPTKGQLTTVNANFSGRG